MGMVKSDTKILHSSSLLVMHFWLHHLPQVHDLIIRMRASSWAQGCVGSIYWRSVRTSSSRGECLDGVNSTLFPRWQMACDLFPPSCWKPSVISHISIHYLPCKIPFAAVRKLASLLLAEVWSREKGGEFPLLTAFNSNSAHYIRIKHMHLTEIV